MQKKIVEDKVAWGIIGVGDVCEVKSAPAMQIVANSSLVAVMRRNGERAADYARRHQVPRWYDEAAALINDPDLNAIYIATPPGSHAEYTKMAAKAGKPVYVEKPMARSLEECRQMINVCQTHGVPLYVAYYRRTLPNFLKIKSLIMADAIGDIRAVNIHLVKSLEPDLIANTIENWRTNPAIAGGGYFFDLASHQLDFLDYLLGPIKSASGFADNQAGIYPAEDIVTACFKFENGVVGTGLWCFTAGKAAEEETTTIIGSKGQISYQNFGDNRVVLQTGKGQEVFNFTMPKHIQEPLIETVVGDLLGTAECPSTGETAARTNRVMGMIVGKNN